jgi:hypothetical protein
MCSRASFFLLSAVLAVIPSAILAQGTAAVTPEVDKALRANVTDFFQDFVDKKFRQALNLVADDTQDKYFASPKAEITEFKISGIGYNDTFTQATVTMDVKVILHLKAEGFLEDSNVPEHWDTKWKIENGKWVYYEPPPPPDAWRTPMGPSAAPAATSGDQPGRVINDQTMVAEARRILEDKGITTGVTPSSVKFTRDKPGTAKIVFRNGMPGQVQISMEGISEALRCLASKVDQVTVNAGQESTIELTYDPASGQTPPGAVNLGVLVAPFNQIFPLQVTFDGN